MIRLTACGPVVVRDDEWTAQQQEFARRHCVVFRGFVDESILERVPRMLETSRFYTNNQVLKDRESTEQGVLSELLMYKTEPLASMFFFLLNQPRLFEAMAEFTGCEIPIRKYSGRLSKLLPGNDGYPWHSDNAHRGPKRLYGLSINLSPEPFVGGSFRLRNKETGEVLRTISTSRFGDAYLFRIHDSLQHMLLEMRSGAPRYAYVGWFTTGREEEDYREMLRKNASP